MIRNAIQRFMYGRYGGGQGTNRKQNVNCLARTDKLGYTVEKRRAAMKRIDKENYYLDIAETVLERSTCLRRCYGAIIVKNDEIVSTGYNGAPRGRKNCMDLGYCTREAMNVPSGERYELCRSVHAEMNAIISAARRDTLGATLYLAGREAKSGELLHDATSCSMCRRLIINAGIDRVVIRNTEREYSVVHVEDWVREDDSLPQQV